MSENQIPSSMTMIKDPILEPYFIGKDTNSYTVSGVTVGYNSGGGYWNGNISNVRLVNGTALYTTTFTPPTQALPTY